MTITNRDMPPRVRHYIADTDHDADPHVVAQWDDDRLTEIVVNVLDDGAELTLEHLVKAWLLLPELKNSRQEVT